MPMPSCFSAVKSLILPDGLGGQEGKGGGEEEMMGNGVPLKKPAPQSHKQRR